MSEFLGQYYLWLKAIHIIFVISWMAAMLYLPRLYNWVKSAVPDFWVRGVTEAFMQLNNDIEEAAERALAIIRNGYNDNTEVSL